MSNSSLVTYTNLSPNCTKPRRGKKLYIIPHCIVGQWTAKQGCDYFAAPGRGASANYVIGKDGSIGLSVDENNRAWTTGGDLKTNGFTGADMDHYAITIEIASDTFPPYKITDAAYNALIKLMADIAKRNNLGPLKWQADKTLVGKPDLQNVLVHRWFASKTCPGDYIYNHLGDIVKKANAINGGVEDMTKEDVIKIIQEEIPKILAMSEEELEKEQESRWAIPSIEEIVKLGIMTQDDKRAEPRISRPKSPLTRQEAAIVANNIIKHCKNPVQE